MINILDYFAAKVRRGLKIAICDNEEFYIEKIKGNLKKLLEERECPAFHIDTYQSGEQLCQKKEKLQEYQIIFLDVNMDQMSGLEAAQEIRNVNKEVFLVFVTAYIDYAVEGYKVDAIRFLIKDALDNTLPECVDTILEKIRYNECKERFSFVEGEQEVSIHNIYFIESEKHKLVFHIFDKDEIRDWTLYGKMDDIEKRLKDYDFIRIHKSFLVNVKMITQVKNYRVTLKREEELPVPREKFRQVKKKYFEMMGEI